MFWYELLVCVPPPIVSTRGGGMGRPSALGSNGSDGAVGLRDSDDAASLLLRCGVCGWTTCCCCGGAGCGCCS